MNGRPRPAARIRVRSSANWCFSHEGRLRHALLREGQGHDELLLAMLSSDHGRPTDLSHYAIRL
jgi:hypothetical protein